MSDGRPPGIPDDAWRRWTARTHGGAAAGRPGAEGGVRRVWVSDGDASNGPCDLCGGEAAPFSRMGVDGGQPFVVCAACRATIARVTRLAGPGPFQVEIAL